MQLGSNQTISRQSRCAQVGGQSLRVKNAPLARFGLALLKK
jgi:hypothetical protein